MLTFKTACDGARRKSESERCTVHVNAIVRIHEVIDVLRRDEPYIAGFDVSNWYVDGSTVVSYYDGEKQDR